MCRAAPRGGARRTRRPPDAEFKSGAEVCEKSDTDSDNKKFKNRAAPGAVGAGAGDFDFFVCEGPAAARGRRLCRRAAPRINHHVLHAFNRICRGPTIRHSF